MPITLSGSHACPWPLSRRCLVLPLGCGASACWYVGVYSLPSGMPLRVPDMSMTDMRLAAVSDEAACSMGTEPLAVDLRGPLRCCRLATPTSTVANASLLSVGPSSRLLWEASSHVVPWASGPSSRICPGSGRRVVGSEGSLSSQALQLLSCLRGAAGRSEPHHQFRWDARGPKPSQR